MKHSFVDFRSINNNLLRNWVNGETHYPQQMSMLLLSECVDALVTNYFDQIKDSSLIMKIIREMYNRRTRKYFIVLFVIYFFGFVIPFVLMITKAIND